MTVSQARFYGGSKANVNLSGGGTYGLHPDTAFAYEDRTAIPTGGEMFFLPDVSANPERWRGFEGRPMFMVWKSSGVSGVPINKSDKATTIGTIDLGQCALITLVDADNDTWHYIERTIDTARTLNMRAGAATPVNPSAAHPTYDPYCFQGNDCEFLRDVWDNVPLDGTGGLNEVVAPLYEDPSYMTNSTREPVRAADVVMPQKILLRLDEDCFSVDTNHPWYGTYSLIDSFFDALYGNAGDDTVLSGDGSTGTGQNRPWILQYDTTLSYPTTGAGTSSMPYHSHRTTSAWAHGPGGGGMSVLRYVWKAERTYGPDDDPNKYTLQVRFVMEHTMTAPAQADSSGGGVGTTNAYGAHGATFNLYIFTDELNSAWSEGVTTFQPVDFAVPYTWTRADPFASGIANGFSESAGDKGIHPQCVAAATLSMSWHGPVGQNWYPPEEVETIDSSSELGKFMDETYKVPNGSPWSNLGSCADTPPLRYTSAGETTGIKQNVVFGSSTLARAITLGGAFPVSAVNEWLCWENGNGDGTTFLTPAKPGWVEDCGRLDIASGNCGTIEICTSDGDNSADEEYDWVRYEPSPCDGHPDEPFASIGGSHTCFKNATGTTKKGSMDAGTGTHCCVKVTDTHCTFHEYCTRAYDVYGDANPPSSCDLEDSYNEETHQYNTSFPLEVYDYDLGLGSSTNRELVWRHEAGDPLSLDRSYTYDSGSVGTLSDLIGTFTKGASAVTVASVAGASAIRALMRHHDTSSGTWPWYGVNLAGEFDNTLTVGCGAGFFYEETANNATGWGIYVSPAGGGDVTVEVVEYDAGVRSVLDSATISTASTDGVFSFQMQGTKITATYTPSTGTPYSYTGHHYLAQMLTFPMFGCIYTEETVTTGSSFSSLVWTDIVGDINTAVEGRIQDNLIDITLSGGNQYLDGYGQCAGASPGCCGTCCTPACCNCTAWNESLWRHTTASHTATADIDDEAHEVGECEREDNFCDPDNAWTADNPTYSGGPFPGRCRCGSLENQGYPGCTDEAEPLPHRYISFPLPRSKECYKTNTTVGTEEDPDPGCINDIPLMCRGIDYWDWATAL